VSRHTGAAAAATCGDLAPLDDDACHDNTAAGRTGDTNGTPVVQTTTKVIQQNAESLTPRLYLPGGRTRLMIWLEFAIACFHYGGGEFNPQIPPFHGVRNPSNTICH